MEGVFVQVSDVVRTYVPNLLAALAILVVGWLIALAVSALIRAALRRTTIDDRIAAALSGHQSADRIDAAGWISTAVFWVIMLFVLIGFFQALSLPAISTPLNSMLNRLLAFLPNLFGALVLAGIAWLIATVLRLVVSRGLRAARFDERVGGQVSDAPADPERADIQRMLQRDPETGAPIRGAGGADQAVSRAVQRGALSETLANAVYWLVFLLFLPAILDALALEGLLQPVQALLNEVMAYLPNVLAAAAVLVVGWFIARVVQRIVSNLAAAVGVDRLGDRVGINQVLGSQRLSGLLGTLVYVLILVPVLITALNALQIEAVTAPASAMLASFLAALPLIFAAALVLTIAFFVARIIAGVVTNLLRGLGFDRLAARAGLTPPATAAGATPEAQRALAEARAAAADTPEAAQAARAAARTTPSDIAGTLVLVGIMLFAAIAALNLLGFTALTALVAEFTVLIGQILLGLVIFGIGLYLAGLAARAIMSSGAEQRGLFAMAARVAIITLAGAMALRQMGLANEIIIIAFAATIGALAVAFALAFGLGGREAAGREVERLFESIRTRRANERALGAEQRIQQRSVGGAGGLRNPAGD